MRMDFRFVSFVSLAFLAGLAAAAPQYQIVDLGLAPTSFGQGNRVTSGGVAVGRTAGSSFTGYRAFTSTANGGTTTLPTITVGTTVYNYANAYGANDGGTVVGSAAPTFNAGSVPVAWQSGVVTRLALPTGLTAGAAEDVNASGLIVGYANNSLGQTAVVFGTTGSSAITATTAGGSYMNVGYGVNDAGLVAGTGIDPTNAARNVGLVYNSTTGSMMDIGALPGLNGALAFDISENGFVVGSSMMNQGSGLPIIWSAGGGMRAIPLPTGTSQGSAKGVNSAGWAVGTASAAYAIPFVFDGTSTYSLSDLLVNGAGWNLSTNTSSAATSINDNGIIVGTGVYNGATHAFALTPVPEPASFAALGLGALALVRRRRRA